MRLASDAIPVPTLGATPVSCRNAGCECTASYGALKDVEKLPTEVAAADSGEAQFERRATRKHWNDREDLHGNAHG